jgi:hypothetical protein
LRQSPRVPFAAHVRAKDFQPRRFLFADRHDTLHRADARKVTSQWIVKTACIVC